MKVSKDERHKHKKDYEDLLKDIKNKKKFEEKIKQLNYEESQRRYYEEKNKE